MPAMVDNGETWSKSLPVDLREDGRELPGDGRHAWFGCVLLLGSAAVSLKTLGWAASAVGKFIMP